MSDNRTREFSDDVLPPEGEYESRDATLKAINAWAAPRGYAFINGRSTKEKSGRQTVTYLCDRRSKPPDTSTQRKRKTTTRATGCEFSVLAKESLDKTTWALKHRSDLRFSSHNHEPSQHPSAHPAHRTFSEGELSQLKNLVTAGIAPKDIRTYIHQNTTSIATQQDIYNRVADVRREVCEGQSSINAFANQLDREGFWNRMQLGSDDRVTSVLFAHPDSLAYLRAYPDVLILDCTYKTNKYGMPLLDMIGVDACQRSFCIAFAFLSNETEGDFIWALDRLRSLYELCDTKLPSVILTDRCLASMNAVATCFPSATQLLCLWHANKAVLRYCQKGLVNPQQGLEIWDKFYRFWHSIMRSPDEETFDARVQEFEAQFLADHLEEVGYVETNWLNPYKEKLVKAWVDQHPHFGNTVTSRVEGIHGLLKEHLKVSTLNLFEAWQAIKHALLNQLTELRSNQAKQQMRMPIELSGPLYSAVRGWVSHEALRKVEEQRQLLTKQDPPHSTLCTGSFSRSLGLPCSHTVKALLEQNQVLRLGHFHTHWHLNRDRSPVLLIEPRQRKDLITIDSVIPQSSTQREPSGFEMVEAVTQKAPNTCSACHATGHRMTSKACPLRYMELQTKTVPNLQQPYVVQETLQEITPQSPIRATQPLYTQTLSTGRIEAVLTPDQPQLTVRASSTQLLEPIPHLPAQTPSPISSRSASPAPAQSPPLRYNDPKAIYHRYVKARDIWYKNQLRERARTNQQYRKAMGLRLRYSRAEYSWCLNYKQMDKHCTSEGRRDWTEEEMMAYLDWSKAEDDRIDALVAEKRMVEPFDAGQRGMGDMWRRVEKDMVEQQSLYATETEERSCIVVQPE